MSTRHVSRLPAIAVLAGALVFAGIADRGDRAPRPERQGSIASQPTASPADALSSTWYCPSGTAVPGGPADATVVIFNPTDQIISGAMYVVGLEKIRGGRVLTIPARDRVAVRVADVARSPHAATLVQLDRGGAVVEQTIGGANGDSAGPCATTASNIWYFAEGATTRAAGLVYSLFNPFPDDAIVDLSFTTDEGRSAPAAFQGVVVPAGSLIALDIGSHVRRREHISSVVRARRGRLVVGALQTHAGDGRRGASVTLGATSPANAWTFADGLTGPGFVEKLHLFNPGSEESRVAVDLVLDQGETEPFDLRVPPQSRITLDLVAEPRVPKGVGHSLLVRSDNREPIVAQRTIDFGSPGPRTGHVNDMGSPRPAQHWALAAGGATDSLDEWVSVLNASPRPVRVTVRGGSGGTIDALPGLDGVVIPRGKRQAFRIAQHLVRAELPLLIDADGDVFVERFLYRSSGVGVSGSAAVVRKV
ncbi:MAG TPA: DUF5719 family protein [Acidimicrobiales bacterium]|nr:DUF5719 family protein [Acidimicrobiales bacterium]